MNVLVIAPHMDDEVLGCGGTIARHVESGDNVFVCFIAHRVYNHQFNDERNEVEKKHANRAKEVLGYKEPVFLGLNDERLDACIQDIIIPLEDSISNIKPDIVYSPFYGDNNQDHRAVFQAVRVAIRASAKVTPQKWLLYETPSSTDQSPPIIEGFFMPNYYVDISRYVDVKIEAFRCYETERRVCPHPRSEKALKVQAQKRGVEIGFKYAEAFMIMRDKWI